MILRCIASVETLTQGRILLNGRSLFNAVSTGLQDYPVQAEGFQKKGDAIKDQPFLWYVRLDSTRAEMRINQNAKLVETQRHEGIALCPLCLCGYFYK